MKVRVPHDSLLGKGAIKASVFNNGTFEPISGVRDGDRLTFNFEAAGPDVEYAGGGDLVVIYKDETKERK